MSSGCKSSLTSCEDNGRNKKGSTYASHPFTNTNLSVTGSEITIDKFKNGMDNYYKSIGPEMSPQTKILPGVYSPTKPGTENISGVPTPTQAPIRPSKEYFDGGCYAFPEDGEAGPNCSNYPGDDHAQPHRYACPRPKGCGYVAKGQQVGGLATNQHNLKLRSVNKAPAL